VPGDIENSSKQHFQEFLTTKLFVARKKLIKLYNITGFLI
jgi:hypothetical protein